jgi:hypothetical protein
MAGRWSVVAGFVVATACGRSGDFGGVSQQASEDEGSAEPDALECPEPDDEGPAPRLVCSGATADVLGYWPLDDGGAEGVAYDAGPLGNHGAIDGATRVNEGRYGRALRFPGFGSVTVDGPGLQPRRSVTMTAWVNPATLSTEWNSVVSKGGQDDTLDRYWLGYYGLGLRVHFSDGEVNTSLTDAQDYSSHLGQWHHLGGTFDGCTGEVSIYLDGELVARSLEGPPELGYDGAPLRIGTDTNFGDVGWPFSGVIDEVKLFGCTLDEAQMAADAATNWPF